MDIVEKLIGVMPIFYRKAEGFVGEHEIELTLKNDGTGWMPWIVNVKNINNKTKMECEVFNCKYFAYRYFSKMVKKYKLLEIDK